MASNFFYYGRADGLSGLVASPFRYSPNSPQDYNEYMNGYNSVSKLEKPSRNDLLKSLEDFKKNGKTRI